MTGLPYDQRPYRPGVGLVLIGPGSRIFVGRRIDTTAEAWQLPQGGIDDGETPSDAALRELEEEVGNRAAELVAQSAGWLDYDLPEPIADRVWKGRYRGQRQKWFALKFLGTDADIVLDSGLHKPEFNAWRWAAPDEVISLAVEFKRALYAQVLDEFRDVLA